MELEGLSLKTALNSKTLGRSSKMKKKKDSKGSVASSHTQSSAQLLAEEAGFYQCHSSINAEASLTVTSITVERRRDAEEQLQSG